MKIYELLATHLKLDPHDLKNDLKSCDLSISDLTRDKIINVREKISEAKKYAEHIEGTYEFRNKKLREYSKFKINLNECRVCKLTFKVEIIDDFKLKIIEKHLIENCPSCTPLVSKFDQGINLYIKEVENIRFEVLCINYGVRMDLTEYETIEIKYCSQSELERLDSNLRRLQRLISDENFLPNALHTLTSKKVEASVIQISSKMAEVLKNLEESDAVDETLVTVEFPFPQKLNLPEIDSSLINTYTGLMDGIRRRVKKDSFHHNVKLGKRTPHGEMLEIEISPINWAFSDDFEGGALHVWSEQTKIRTYEIVEVRLRGHHTAFSTIVIEADELEFITPTYSFSLTRPNFLKKLEVCWSELRDNFQSIILKAMSFEKPYYGDINLDQVPEHLNSYQKDAFQLLGNECGIIWGPPGTGKSTTITAMTHLLTSQNKKVLLVTYNNRTLDEIYLKTIKGLEANTCRLGTGLDLMQYPELNDKRIAEYKELNGRFTSKSCSVQERNSLRKKLKSIRTKIAKEEESKFEMGICKFVAVTCIGATFKYEELKAKNFDYIIFDETSQIPVAVTLLLSTLGKTTIYAGDPKQLEPVAPNCDSNTERFWFSNSLFEYLPQEHLESIQKRAFLAIQQRMHPGIAEVISDLFYEKKMFSPNTSQFLQEKSFNGMECDEGNIRAGINAIKVTEKSEKLFNKLVRYESLNRSVHLVHELVKRHGISQEKILILTPYVGQVQLYRQKLDESGLVDVGASTIHKSQGGEADFIIFDTVKIAGSPLFKEPKAAQRLLCVAMSRAKKALIVYFNDEDVSHNGDLVFCNSDKFRVTRDKFEEKSFYLRVVKARGVQLSKDLIDFNQPGIQYIDIGHSSEDFFLRMDTSGSIREILETNFLNNISCTHPQREVCWKDLRLEESLKAQFYEQFKVKWNIKLGKNAKKNAS